MEDDNDEVERERITSKIGKGRLIGKGLGIASAVSSKVVEVMPGAKIVQAAKGRAVEAVVSCVPDAPKEWVKDKAVTVGKKVMSTEVGRNVAVGVVQGKVNTDQKLESVSDKINEVSPTFVGNLREGRKDFQDKACEKISNVGKKEGNETSEASNEEVSIFDTSLDLSNLDVSKSDTNQASNTEECSSSSGF
jgi:hypothetical protein